MSVVTMTPAWRRRRGYPDLVDDQPTPDVAVPVPPPDTSNWQPGVPSLRNMLPSIIGGAVVPLTVYYLVRHHVHSDADALIIAGIFPAAWVSVQFIRQRRIDPVGAIVLFGFIVGVAVSELLGGNAYVLKARDSVFTGLFGIVFLVSLVAAKRPAIFYIGRLLSAGDDPERIAAYDELHDLPGGEHTFRILTMVWGIGLLLDAGTRLLLAAVMSTGPFLATSPVISAVFLGGMFAFTVRYANVARARGEELRASELLPPTDPLN